MKTKNQIETLNSSQGDFKEKSFAIKIGNCFYEIPERQIAYVYQNDGMTSVVNKYGIKLTTQLNDLDEIASALNSKIFYKISEEAIINRGSVRLLEHINEYNVVAYNAHSKNIFRVPKYLETDFIDWISS